MLGEQHKVCSGILCGQGERDSPRKDPYQLGSVVRSVYLNDQLRCRYSGEASNHLKNIQTFPPLVQFLSLSYWPLPCNGYLITTVLSGRRFGKDG